MDKIILSAEEITALKSLRDELSKISTTLGAIELETHELSLFKADTLNKVAKLKQDQRQIGKLLEDKYGKGEVNIDTGEFTKG